MTGTVGPDQLAHLLDPGIELTAEQAAVIGAPFESRLVEAGAGSGKTLVMALRVVYLVVNHLALPEQILGLTFTRKAAAELASRIRRALRATSAIGPQDIGGVPTVSTYDAYAGGLVKNYGLRRGFDPDARLISAAESWALACEVVEGWNGQLPGGEGGAEEFVSLNVDELARRVLKMAEELTNHGVSYEQFADEVSRLKAACELPDSPTPGGRRGRPPALPEALKSGLPALEKRLVTAHLAGRYQQLKAERGLVNFFDQAARAAQIASQDQDARQSESEQFKAVLLDEFQDTSTPQLELLATIFRGTPVMAVGDSNQAIYGWRGASAAALDQFRTRFATAGHAPSPEPVPRLTLSQARRNDLAILDIANQLVQPFRQAASDGQAAAPVLRPRPEAGQGVAQVAYLAAEGEEAQAVAEFMNTHWQATLDSSEPRTAAVLVRKGGQIAAIVKALEAAGLEYQVIGRGGLLAAPEVRDVVCALTASQDLTRGDAFMRLAASPRFAIGISDLQALDRMLRSPHGRGEPHPAEEVFALDRLDALTNSTEPPPGLSAEGLRRLRGLGAMLRRIRGAARHLGLPELVIETERVLGLDIDLLARFGPAGRAQILRLATEAHGFGLGQDRPSVTAFLSWLEAEEDIGSGLEPAETPAPGGAIQVLTIHAAKGLEWDVVAVPGLEEGGLPGIEPTKGQYRALGWLSDSRRAGASGGLPWGLRLDRDSLPTADLGAVSDRSGLRAACEDLVTRMGQHFLDEDRRVAYVAATRAKTHLLLSGHWSRPDRLKLAPPGLFMEELAEAGLVDRSTWAPKPEDSETLEAPPLGAGPELDVPIWPEPDPLGGRAPEVRAGAQAVIEAMERFAADASATAAASPLSAQPVPSAKTSGDRSGGIPPVRQTGSVSPVVAISLLEGIGSDLALQAAAFLRQAGQDQRTPSVQLGGHLTTTTLSHLLTNPDSAALDLRRPIPHQPSRGASIGQEFHRLAALDLAARGRLAGVQLTLDESDLAPVPSDSQLAATVQKLLQRFRESQWMTSAFTPRSVEATVESVQLGRTLIARIDATFTDSAGRIVVVDWKTTRSNRGSAWPVHSAQVRLYQAALAQMEGQAPEDIIGFVHYVSENLSVPVAWEPFQPLA
ncbi:MAG: ATP-dependent helicase [Bifidobacteriaceae bacterium]|jgi:DNA helicase-2/ATP-dependent DNA helicase PcrA|nr:ATP-dependent helicase [Bifidobacteriaceae bacterium]